MKNKRIEGRTVLALLLVTTLSLTACKKKDVFQQEMYNELLTEACPVDPIDASHRWTTTTRRMVTVYDRATAQSLSFQADMADMADIIF